jgi:DNA-binding response OmpR family regulator
MAATILTVDDDIRFQELLRLFLTSEGYDVVQAYNGEKCLAHIHSHHPDLILLDIHMPDTDGIALCRTIRKMYHHPILFLTGNKLQTSKLNSLQAGGDDYLTKPFDRLELAARVRSHMRWGALLKASQSSRDKLTFPGLEIDLSRKTVLVNGEPVILLAKELHLLITLAQNPQRVYHPRQLHELIWEDLAGYSSDLIKAHIYNLRKKIERDPTQPQYIHTIRGFGYKFDLLQ